MYLSVAAPARHVARIVFVAGFSLALFAFGVTAALQPATDKTEIYPVAVRSFGVWIPETRERFDFSVWYPGRTTMTAGVMDGWITEAGKQGRVVPGFYPLALLSHDTAGSRFAHNDLATALASAGMIVVTPTHSGDNQNSSDAVYTAELLHDRPRNLLRALETVLGTPEFAPYADESRIGLIGVGFGGITIFQLLGLVPDFSLLDSYCGEDGREDGFCAPWTAERLSRLPEAMRTMTRTRGRQVFTPPLSLFAPRLLSVTVPGAPADAVKNPEEGAATAGNRSWWQRLFGDNDDGEPSAAGVAPPPAPAGEDADAPPPGSSADFPLLLDFQGGPLFGGTDSGADFVHIALYDSPQYRVPVRDGGGDAAGPEPVPIKIDASMPFRRKAETRAVRAAALLAPAGGMLFSPSVLSSVAVPVAVVEAGLDTLYPPDRHSQPYLLGAASPPQLLRMDNADHFSLFASCSSDAAAIPGETCGRLSGQDRRKADEERNRFLVSFFQSVLGGSEKIPEPTGFVAMPDGR
jgi:predicted dienelactone hydrolase